MKVFLLHPDRDFDARVPGPNAPIQFAQDLELGVVLSAAAAGDRYLYDVMSAAFASAMNNDIETALHRQEILKDCLATPSIIRQFYSIAIEPFSRDKSWNFSLYGRDPSARASSAVRTLQSSLEVLRRLRNTCFLYADRFSSKGFRRFFDVLARNLDDAYLDAAGADLNNLTFRSGLLLSAQVGDGGKEARIMLRKPQPRDLSWFQWAFTPGPQSYTLQLHPRDEAGAQAFNELENQGISLISEAVYQSAEHVLGFLASLRQELAFYIGCLNLNDKLTQAGELIVFPEICEERQRLAFRGLRDASLSLTLGRRAIGNDVDANGKSLLIVTGANRGGKSTFLRSVGLAQVMMHCGLFVTADLFSSSAHKGLFTHYKREEDRSMRSGKFDEELMRMNAIAEGVRDRSIVLFNELFAATHEREGSEIARQIVSALRERGVDVLFVSHMYEFAKTFLDDRSVLFLRADRDESGARTFQLKEAKPLPTSFGSDLYAKIFETEAGDGGNMSGKD